MSERLVVGPPWQPEESVPQQRRAPVPVESRSGPVWPVPPAEVAQEHPVIVETARPPQGAEVAAVPPQRWAGTVPPGPWPPDSVPPEAYPPDGYPPGPQLVAEPGADRRLPVLVERPEHRSSRHSLVLAAVLVAGIAAAAAVVVATLPRDEDPEPAAAPPPATAAPPSPSVSAAAPGAVAPAGVTLRDNRDSVSLAWRYPKGSEGPVLISGGRTGQEQRAFQQLPAGTTEYVVYGLNRQNNYCFSVAVVYTVERVAASEAVCTDR